MVYEAVIDACQQAGFTPGEHPHEVAETSTLVSFVAAQAWGRAGASLGAALADHRGDLPAACREATQEVELALATRVGETSPLVARVRPSARRLSSAAGSTISAYGAIEIA